MGFHTYKKTSTLGVKLLQLLIVFMVLVSLIGVQPAVEVLGQDGVTFAVITDFGNCNSYVQGVADMINTWKDVSFIVSAGDNHHGVSDLTCPTGNYSQSVGAYYGEWVSNHKFWPVPGNHDHEAISNYRSYFNYLPDPVGDQGPLYYDFVEGPVHFFMLNSGEIEFGATAVPDEAAQKKFLQEGLAASNAPWKIVVIHISPYTSGNHAYDTKTRWPFAEWGADFVLSGHNHLYERIHRDEGPGNDTEIVYFTSGVAGGSLRNCGNPVSGQESCYGTVSQSNSSYGALKVNATETQIEFRYITVGGAPRDIYSKVREQPTTPSISVSPTSLNFTSQPDVASEIKSYTVNGIRLKGDVTITPPADFEISTAGGPDFIPTDQITLNPTDGILASTTIYARFKRAKGGTSTGNITHASQEATTRNLAVSGTAAAIVESDWVAYNDMSGTSTPAYTTEFTLGQTNGMLLDFDSGDETGVTVTVNYYPPSGQTGTPYNYTSGGSMPVSGTDAHEIFNNKVNLEGVIMSATSNETDYWVDLEFNNLDPAKTYTFAATANRAGGSSYSDRATLYTISEIVSATYASSIGAEKTSEYSVYFTTGENTNNGYVAKWVNIDPGIDRSFTVRAQPQDSQNPRSYTFGGFMLQEEKVSTPERYNVTFDANGGTPVPTTIEVTFGTAYGPLPTTSRAGYTFNGWFTAESGGDEIKADTTVNIDSAHTLYAQWTANEYKVTFDANGGTPVTETKQVIFGTAYGPLPTTSRKGYIFTGWFTAASGGTKVEADTIVAIASAHTLHAQWETFTIFLPLVLK